jgi:TonB family protein
MRTHTLIAFAILTLFFGSITAAQSAESLESGANSSHPTYRVGGPAESRLIYAPDPEYTNAAKEKRIEGTVVLAVTVGEDGVPRSIRIVKPLDPGLDQNAIDAVRTWKFKPFIKDGTPQAVPVTLELNFRLPK